MIEIALGEIPQEAQDAWVKFVGAWRQQMLDDGYEEQDGVPSIDGFRYHQIEDHGYDDAFIAEPIQVGGPREPAYIWSGSRWFCSEDGTDEELELGRRLSALCPGGIGGF